MEIDTRSQQQWHHRLFVTRYARWDVLVAYFSALGTAQKLRGQQSDSAGGALPPRRRAACPCRQGIRSLEASAAIFLPSGNSTCALRSGSRRYPGAPPWRGGTTHALSEPSNRIKSLWNGRLSVARVQRTFDLQLQLFVGAFIASSMQTSNQLLLEGPRRPLH